MVSVSVVRGMRQSEHGDMAVTVTPRSGLAPASVLSSPRHRRGTRAEMPRSLSGITCWKVLEAGPESRSASKPVRLPSAFLPLISSSQSAGRETAASTCCQEAKGRTAQTLSVH